MRSWLMVMKAPQIARQPVFQAIDRGEIPSGWSARSSSRQVGILRQRGRQIAARRASPPAGGVRRAAQCRCLGLAGEWPRPRARSGASSPPRREVHQRVRLRKNRGPVRGNTIRVRGLYPPWPGIRLDPAGDEPQQGGVLPAPLRPDQRQPGHSCSGTCRSIGSAPPGHGSGRRTASWARPGCMSGAFGAKKHGGRVLSNGLRALAGLRCPCQGGSVLRKSSRAFNGAAFGSEPCHDPSRPCPCRRQRHWRCHAHILCCLMSKSMLMAPVESTRQSSKRLAAAPDNGGNIGAGGVHRSAHRGRARCGRKLPPRWSKR